MTNDYIIEKSLFFRCAQLLMISLPDAADYQHLATAVMQNCVTVSELYLIFFSSQSEMFCYRVKQECNGDFQICSLYSDIHMNINMQ